MKTVCKLVCEDCGPVVIIHPEYISVVKLGDSYEYATRCRYCHRPKVGEIDKEMADYLEGKGVTVNAWL